ncbi:MAG TPA: hypothetical protein VFG43_03395 [Geminicoccaceae bacterium]|nr:hypothetical protein [Geminicoccaceae bacterium]
MEGARAQYSLLIAVAITAGWISGLVAAVLLLPAERLEPLEVGIAFGIAAGLVLLVALGLWALCRGRSGGLPWRVAAGGDAPLLPD